MTSAPGHNHDDPETQRRATSPLTPSRAQRRGRTRAAPRLTSYFCRALNAPSPNGLSFSARSQLSAPAIALAAREYAVAAGMPFTGAPWASGEHNPRMCPRTCATATLHHVRSISCYA
eukprot:scaffold3221_cov118-Isochrysis_galbana.AAC.2